MLPAEVMRQIRRLQVRAKRPVRTLLGGEYRSAFKGAGLSFEEVREYQPGDEVRQIDFGTGNDLYKADWMDQSRQLHRLSLFNPRTATGLIGAARESLSSARAAIRRARG